MTDTSSDHSTRSINQHDQSMQSLKGSLPYSLRKKTHPLIVAHAIQVMGIARRGVMEGGKLAAHGMSNTAMRDENAWKWRRQRRGLLDQLATAVASQEVLGHEQEWEG